MTEPGLDRHDWESVMQSIEDGIHDDPVAALPELDGVVSRVLDETGIDANDEARREFLAAREVTRAVERGDEISPGDVAAAINGYRAVFDYVVTLGLPES